MPTRRASADATPGPSRDHLAAGADRNEVFLLGRLSGLPVERELPSGDVVLTWRVVVGRGVQAQRGRDRSATHDTIDCQAWTARVRRTVSSWADGDLIEAEGALRRRFWRVGDATTSRTEVEVTKARRVARGVTAAAG
jgi:single-strand DNA-binding protein